LFLIVAGATGAVLAFAHELDAALNPELFLAPAQAGAPRRDPVLLRDALEASLPVGARVTRVPLDTPQGHTVVFSIAPAHEGDDDEYFVDPVTGAIVGSRRWGDLKQGRRNVVPFVFRLHTGLALGTVGEWLLGVMALLWTLDCIVAAAITWPSPAPPRAWLARWRPAWLVRASSLFSFVFTWHRASGLWIWGMLLLFAWSGVALNLSPVYTPLMRALGSDTREPTSSSREPPPSYATLLERGRRVAAEEAKAAGFSILSERRLVHEPERGVVRYQVRSSKDVSDRYAGTTFELDSQTGALLRTVLPTGGAPADTFTTWLLNLHFGSVAVLGAPYRALVSAVGGMVVALSVSGVVVFVRRKLRAMRPVPPAGLAQVGSRRSPHARGSSSRTQRIRR
jgi:uncharacterized iron-regulated membrane protein